MKILIHRDKIPVEILTHWDMDMDIVVARQDFVTCHMSMMEVVTRHMAMVEVVTRHMAIVMYQPQGPRSDMAQLTDNRIGESDVAGNYF